MVENIEAIKRCKKNEEGMKSIWFKPPTIGRDLPVVAEVPIFPAVPSASVPSDSVAYFAAAAATPPYASVPVVVPENEQRFYGLPTFAGRVAEIWRRDHCKENEEDRHRLSDCNKIYSSHFFQRKEHC